MEIYRRPRRPLAHPAAWLQTGPLAADPDHVARTRPTLATGDAHLHRRHLDQSQRAMCAARAEDYYKARAKERMKRGTKADPVANCPQGSNGKARDEAGAAFGVSGKNVDRASHVLKGGCKELITAVKTALTTPTAPCGSVRRLHMAPGRSSRRW